MVARIATGSPVLLQKAGFKVLNSFRPGDAFHQGNQLFRDIRFHNFGERLSDNFISRISKEPFGGRIPRKDRAIQSPLDNGFPGGANKVNIVLHHAVVSGSENGKWIKSTNFRCRQFEYRRADPSSLPPATRAQIVFIPGNFLPVWILNGENIFVTGTDPGRRLTPRSSCGKQAAGPVVDLNVDL